MQLHQKLQIFRRKPSEALLKDPYMGQNPRFGTTDFDGSITIM